MPLLGDDIMELCLQRGSADPLGLVLRAQELLKGLEVSQSIVRD